MGDRGRLGPESQKTRPEKQVSKVEDTAPSRRRCPPPRWHPTAAQRDPSWDASDLQARETHTVLSSATESTVTCHRNSKKQRASGVPGPGGASAHRPSAALPEGTPRQGPCRNLAVRAGPERRDAAREPPGLWLLGGPCGPTAGEALDVGVRRQLWPCKRPCALGWVASTPRSRFPNCERLGGDRERLLLLVLHCHRRHRRAQVSRGGGDIQEDSVQPSPRCLRGSWSVARTREASQRNSPFGVFDHQETGRLTTRNVRAAAGDGGAALGPAPRQRPAARGSRTPRTPSSDKRLGRSSDTNAWPSGRSAWGRAAAVSPQRGRPRGEVRPASRPTEPSSSSRSCEHGDGMWCCSSTFLQPRGRRAREPREGPGEPGDAWWHARRPHTVLPTRSHRCWGTFRSPVPSPQEPWS